MRRTPTVVGLTGAAALVLARLHYLVRPEDVPNPYAGTHLTIAVTSLTVGVWLCRRRPDQAVGRAVLAAGALAAWMYLAQPLVVELQLAGAPHWLLSRSQWVIVWPWLAVRSLLLIVAPSMAFAELLRRPRRAVLLAGWVVTALLCAAQWTIFANQSLDESVPSPPLNALQHAAEDLLVWLARGQWVLGILAVAGLAVAGAGLGGNALRRQSRALVVGAALMGLVALGQLGREILPDWPWPGDRVELVASALFPVALAWSVAVDHLFDTVVVVRRIVQYALLTGAGALVYLTVWVVLVEGFAASDGVTRAVSAAALAAALLPSHHRLQRWVDHRVYGASSRPQEVLRQIGVRLSAAPGSSAALEALAAAVHDAMRLPWVGIELVLVPGSPPQTVATAGERPANDDVELFPIEYGGRVLGRLAVSRRSPVEPLRGVERVTLEELALQAGVVANDLQLEAQLRTSRQQLVLAREEERRRLRADLHDGLGPTLASVAMGLDAASVHLQDPRLRELMTDLTGDVRTAIDDIRRLVYGLRPPALDEFGLVSAVQQHAASLAARATNGLEVSVVAGALPPLPAAVEVAAYRISLEALTNVTRHSGAQFCGVSFEVRGGDLLVEIADDGVGFVDRGVGVGLASMRERAEELQGVLELSDRVPGTLVSARLPIGSEARS